MKSATLDASVVAAAFFREPHAQAAARILASERKLHAPDLLYAEVGNVIWKRRRRGELSDDEALDLIHDLVKLPLIVTAAQELVSDALQLALNLNRTVYDCIYVALAVRTGAPLISVDQRLVNALTKTPFSANVLFVGDVSR
jgi:predicted nucleic acid-binding protein